MDPARLRLVVPDDHELLTRLAARLDADGEPRVSVSRAAAAVLAFEAQTGDMMSRSRVIQALADVAGPDWQTLVDPLDSP